MGATGGSLAQLGLATAVVAFSFVLPHDGRGGRDMRQSTTSRWRCHLDDRGFQQCCEDLNCERDHHFYEPFKSTVLPVCSGRCQSGEELFGLKEYGNVMASIDPDCPKHGKDSARDNL